MKLGQWKRRISAGRMKGRGQCFTIAIIPVLAPRSHWGQWLAGPCQPFEPLALCHVDFVCAASHTAISDHSVDLLEEK
jgi:hypothetical protein